MDIEAAMMVRRVLLFGLLAVGAVASAQELPCRFLRVTPDIDGEILEDPAWGELEWHELRTLSSGAEPVRPTRFKIAYGATAFYLAVWCREPKMAQLKAHAGDMGDIWFDDCVEVFFACGDGVYDHLLVNTAGKRTNLRYDREGSSVSGLWNWQAEIRKYPEYWTVEMEIPYVELNLGNTFLDGVSFNLSREAQVDGLELSTFAVLEGNFHDADHFAKLNPVHSAGAESIFPRYLADLEMRRNLKVRGRLAELRRQAEEGDRFAVEMWRKHAAALMRLEELAALPELSETEQAELNGLEQLLDQIVRNRNQRISEAILDELFAEE